MRNRTARLVAVLALLLTPGLASAQTSDGGFVRGLGGVTFGSETSGIVGFGARAHTRGQRVACSPS